MHRSAGGVGESSLGSNWWKKERKPSLWRATGAVHRHGRKEGFASGWKHLSQKLKQRATFSRRGFSSPCNGHRWRLKKAFRHSQKAAERKQKAKRWNIEGFFGFLFQTPCLKRNKTITRLLRCGRQKKALDWKGNRRFHSPFADTNKRFHSTAALGHLRHPEK